MQTLQIVVDSANYLKLYMQTLQRVLSIVHLQRVLSKIVHADSAKSIIYADCTLQTLQRVLSKIVHADSAKSII